VYKENWARITCHSWPYQGFINHFQDSHLAFLITIVVLGTNPWHNCLCWAISFFCCSPLWQGIWGWILRICVSVLWKQVSVCSTVLSWYQLVLLSISTEGSLFGHLTKWKLWKRIVINLPVSLYYFKWNLHVINSLLWAKIFWKNGCWC
jgi:hypothetical protein